MVKRKVNKNKKMSNQLLLGLAIFLFCLTLVNLLVVFGKMDSPLTGHATDTGTANVTIIAQASITFTTDSVDWGSGAVDAIETSATLDTEGTVTGGNWSTVSNGLVLQNNGNSNVSITLAGGKNAGEFIGGTSPTYKLKVSENEANSCGTIVMSTYTEVDKTDQSACSNMGYEDSQDALDVDIEIVIPEDATPGEKTDTITATATVL